jgi:quinol monooxygenase YgiN
MITITAFIRYNEDSAALEKLTALLAQLIHETRKEPGCQRYDLHEVIDQPGLFIMMEEWASEVALETHNASEHFTNFVASAEAYLTAPIEEFQSKRFI